MWERLKSWIPRAAVGAVAAALLLASQRPWWYAVLFERYKCEGTPTVTSYTLGLFPRESETVLQAVCRTATAPNWFLKQPGSDRNWEVLRVDQNKGTAIHCTCNVVPR